MEVLDLAVGGPSVNGYEIGCEGNTENVFVTRGADAGVLIQGIDRVIRSAQVPAIGIAAGSGAFAVADVVEIISELLPGEGRPIRPEMAGSNEFIPVVVVIQPNR